jgi:phosphatidylglycerophosphate synthase
MTDELNRRPLASRQTKWAHALTKWLARSAVTPNQISGFSMVAAAAAGACIWLSGSASDWQRAALLLAAALGCQLRLLCNLFDGMVAIEAGKKSADGVFWNEFPDRISDILILVGAGYGVGIPSLGWAAASFAILTAYTRELGCAAGFKADFSGPMAKQHRMAVITVASVVAIVEPLWGDTPNVLEWALWIIILGAAFTALRRAARIVKDLKQSN